MKELRPQASEALLEISVLELGFSLSKSQKVKIVSAGIFQHQQVGHEGYLQNSFDPEGSDCQCLRLNEEKHVIH